MSHAKDASAKIIFARTRIRRTFKPEEKLEWGPILLQPIQSFIIF
jgi:hypothetical protein